MITESDRKLLKDVLQELRTYNKGKAHQKKYVNARTLKDLAGWDDKELRRRKRNGELVVVKEGRSTKYDISKLIIKVA